MALRETFALVRDSVKEFLDDDCQTQAAALSYYTIFSLPPLLVLILMLLGAVLDPQDIRGHLEVQLSGLMGATATEQIRNILEQARAPGAGGGVTAVLSVLALLLGATGAFGQLQAAINRSWEVAPDPDKGGIKQFVLKRVFSFGMILSVAFLLLVSLVLSAALTAFGGALGSMLPDGVSATLLQVVNQVLSLVVIAGLFAALFKVLPDARVAWRDVLVGGAATAVLFVLGKFLIGLYLGRSNPGEAFGAAGSLAVLLVWIYYSSMILLFGAEFTQLWAERRGQGIAPERGAIRVVRQRKELREGTQTA
jgi:membrane protein